MITQPDKPKGRGKKLAFSPVKEYALAHGLAVLQPERVKAPEFVEELRKYNAELIAVTAFGQWQRATAISSSPSTMIFSPFRFNASTFTYSGPELIAVTAFGQILPEEILNMPEYGCINVHGSLLPKYPRRRHFVVQRFKIILRRNLHFRFQEHIARVHAFRHKHGRNTRL